MFFLKKVLDDNDRADFLIKVVLTENTYFIIDDTFHCADTKQFFTKGCFRQSFLEVETSIVIKVKLTLFVNNKIQIFKIFAICTSEIKI